MSPPPAVADQIEEAPAVPGEVGDDAPLVSSANADLNAVALNDDDGAGHSVEHADLSVASEGDSVRTAFCSPPSSQDTSRFLLIF